MDEVNFGTQQKLENLFQPLPRTRYFNNVCMCKAVTNDGNVHGRT